MRIVAVFALVVAASLAVLMQLARRTAATLTTSLAAAGAQPSVSSVCATLWGRRGAAQNASESQRVAAKWGTVAQRQRAARNDSHVAHAHLRAVREGIAESAERFEALLGPSDAYVRGLREGSHQLLRYASACVDARDMSAWQCGRGAPAAAPRTCFSQWFVLRPAEARCARPLRRGATWLVDVSHGYTRRWDQIFHFANAMFSANDVAEAGALDSGAATGRGVSTIALYQVESASALRRAGDWFEATVDLLRARLGADALLFGEDFAAQGGALCFEDVFVVQKRLSSPHWHAATHAHAYRRHALRHHRLWSAVARAPRHATLLLRTDERRWLNRAELGAELPAAIDAELRRARARRRSSAARDGHSSHDQADDGEAQQPPLPTQLALEVHELSGALSFRWQLALFGATALLITPHGAQLTNVVFMPSGAAVIEVLNCGHFTDVPKKLALECGLRYVQTIDGAPGCDAPLGKRHINDDRNVSLENELRPALRAVMASWALEPQGESTS